MERQKFLYEVCLKGKVLSSCNKMSVSTRGELAVFVLLYLLTVSGMAVLWWYSQELLFHSRLFVWVLP